MRKAINRVGDALLQRFVPKTEAKAAGYVICYCHDYYGTWVVKYCYDNGTCTPCQYLTDVNCVV